VGGEAPVTPVSGPDSSSWTFPTNRAITGLKSLPLEEEGTTVPFLHCALDFINRPAQNIGDIGLVVFVIYFSICS
jgi:hypothetical protein